MLPLDCWEVGSIASTATFLPIVVRKLPKASMNVLLPTPGTPVIPILTDFPLFGKHWLMIC